MKGYFSLKHLTNCSTSEDELFHFQLTGPSCNSTAWSGEMRSWSTRGRTQTELLKSKREGKRDGGMHGAAK